MNKNLNLQFQIMREGDGRVGYFDPLNQNYYLTPTALVRDKFQRNGRTNNWNGPNHVYVSRQCVWVKIKELNGLNN